MKPFRRRTNRKGMELSINFLVTLILSAVVFSLGLGLAYKMFASAGDLNKGIDQQNQDELLRLLNTGENVVIPFNNEVVPSGQTHTYWLGLMNTRPTAVNFQINAVCTSFAPTGGGSTICPTSANGITLKTKSLISNIAPQSSTQDPIVAIVSKRAPVGTYIVDVSVTYTVTGTATGPTQYGTKKKIYVEVP